MMYLRWIGEVGSIPADGMQAAKGALEGAGRGLARRLRKFNYSMASAKGLAYTPAQLSCSPAPSARFIVPACSVTSCLHPACMPRLLHPCAGVFGNVCRSFSNQSDLDLNCKLQDIDELFVEARELLSDALDSFGTTYFEDDLDVSICSSDAACMLKTCCQP